MLTNGLEAPVATSERKNKKQLGRVLRNDVQQVLKEKVAGSESRLEVDLQVRRHVSDPVLGVAKSERPEKTRSRRSKSRDATMKQGELMILLQHTSAHTE